MAASSARPALLVTPGHLRRRVVTARDGIRPRGPGDDAGDRCRARDAEQPPAADAVTGLDGRPLSGSGTTGSTGTGSLGLHDPGDLRDLLAQGVERDGQGLDVGVGRASS